ncbi:ABC transporter ATP-binding protein [Phytohabitans kaempferiae]|uniref:ABC transporter ATP-binding protein n=1 Tax=Phytohabitans kaempferiae TaxID=1620943 RepID=A0ABV6M527_9ACTN
MAELELVGLSKRYGRDLVLDDVSLSVEEGELVTVLGQSGSGKTTMLRSIAGFVTPSGGDILVHGRSVLNAPINQRGIGIVFQNYALFPHLTVRQNVGYGLRVRRLPRQEIRERVDRELERVMLTPYADRKPGQLSGGQQQRVAVARALVLRPRIVLFDEPFSNLDAMLREGLRRELRDLQKRLRFTAMFVTHDQREAMALADRVAVMRGGRLVQMGAPTDVYERPAERAIAELLGRANLLDCQRSTDADGGALLRWHGHTLRTEDDLAVAGTDACVLLRPEYVAVRPGAPDSPAPNQLGGVLSSVEYHGSSRLAVISEPGGGTLLADLRSGPADPHLAPGAPVTASWPAAAVRLIGD